MIINKEKFRLNITELLMIVISGLFAAGIRSWFSGCPASAENIMTCHWAETVLKAMSIVFIVITVCHILIPDQKIKAGMDIPFFCISILAMFIPGSIISLCMSAGMACRTSMRPWNMILCAALAAVCAADFILQLSTASGAKHHRKAQ